ncbi:hypothetical protein HNR65_000607 [Desulfosalsimonas propionicica]|uniref:Uncharacterized protein n=1 Tax=Desulfosalsimonas propionicica TaxID=332175 RepID=A0A7W0C757_9BACT|nr:hypothetical protein [Desulfosalsimonas propionicica]MBA2880300.1 hypothetical protein [Desulfosalsimonas propionicica]
MEKDDARLRKQTAQRAKDGELPCSVAFEIANQLNTLPAAVGACADEMKLRLVKCQLGLFGYSPNKKIVKARPEVSDALRRAIGENLENGRLPCKRAFAIAADMGLRKMDISGACETLGIKIKPCQLGAF